MGGVPEEKGEVQWAEHLVTDHMIRITCETTSTSRDSRATAGQARVIEGRVDMDEPGDLEHPRGAGRESAKAERSE